MGQISVPGPYSGKSYPIIIAGNIPTDEEYGRISEYIRTQEAAVKADLEGKYGAENIDAPDDGTAIGRAYRRGIAGGNQAIGELLETTGQKSGIAALADYGTEYGEEARQELGEENILQSTAQRPIGRYQEVEDLNTGLEYLGGLIGGTGSSLKNAFVGAGVGAAAGSVIPGAGTVAGASVGFTAGLVPEFAGKNLEAQEVIKGENSPDVNLSLALGTAVAQALAERLGLKAMAAMGINPNAVGKKLAQRIASGAFKGGGTEGLTETFQAAAERLQSGAPMDQVFDEEGIDQLKNAFVGGTLLGTGVGGVAGGIRGPRPEPTDPNAAPPPPAEVTLGLNEPIQPETPKGITTDYATDEAKLAEYETLMASLRGQDKETFEARKANKKTLAEAESPLDKAKREYEKANPAAKVKPVKPVEPQLDMFSKIKGKKPRTAAELADAAVVKADAAVVKEAAKQAALDKKAASTLKRDKQVADEDAKKAQEEADKAKQTLTDAQGTENKAAEATATANVEETISTLDAAKNRVSELAAAVLANTPNVDTAYLTGITNPDEFDTTTVPKEAPVDSADSTSLRTFKEYLADKIGDTEAKGGALKAAEFMQEVSSPQDLAEARALGFDLPDDSATYADIIGAMIPKLDPEIEPVVEPEAEDVVEAAPVVEPEANNVVEQLYKPNAAQQYLDSLVNPDGSNAVVKDETTTVEEEAAAPENPLISRIQSIIVDKFLAIKSSKVDSEKYLNYLINAAYTINPVTGLGNINRMDPTNDTDKQNIIELLESSPAKLKKVFGGEAELLGGAEAAKRYFQTALNPGLAVDSIAHDVIMATANSQVQKNMSPEEVYYFKGKNNSVAKKAQKWLEEFLDPDTYAYYVAVKRNFELLKRNAANAARRRSNTKETEANLRKANVSPNRDMQQQDTDAAIDKVYNDIEAQREADALKDKRNMRRDAESDVTLSSAPQVRSVSPLTKAERAQIAADNAARAKGEARFNEFVAQGVESGLYKPLPSESVSALDNPMSPTAMGLLASGKLKETLHAIAQGHIYPNLAKLANTLADVVGTTKIVFVPDLVDMEGVSSAGQFDPKTNTISINPKTGRNVHTILHEMVHAAVSASLAKNSASTLALRNVFNDVKDLINTEYGATNLDEFVSEALSNPKFQDMLAQLLYKGDLYKGKTALQRIYNAITNFIRRMQGLQSKPVTSALSEIDYLIEGVLAPAPQYRDAGSLALASPAEANNVLNTMLTNGPIFNANGKAKYLAFLEDATKNVSLGLFGGANKMLLQSTPMHYLADISKKYFGELGAKLNNTINEANGAYGRQIDELKNTLLPMVQWGKTNKNLIDKFNRMVNEATRREVDPVLERGVAFKAYGKDPEKMANYYRVKADYDALVAASPDVARIYAVMRNLFRGLRNDIKAAADARLSIVIPDGAIRAKVMKSFYDRLTSKGTIEPYTPLERDGDLWLYYNAVDPITGKFERYSEAFTSSAARSRAWSEAQEQVRAGIRSNQTLMDSLNQLVRQQKQPSIEAAIDAQIDVTEAASISAVNFSNAPPSSFIGQLVKQIRENSPNDTKEQREQTNKIITEIGELVLNTIPETSYMQSFRTRKGTLGNIEDAIKATTKRATLLGRQSVQMKYGNKFEAVKTELAAAYEKAGKEGKTTPAMRDMYDVLVSFADTGTGPNRNQASKALTNIGFNMTLGFNVSGALVNLSQIPLTVYPVYGAKYGYDQTTAAIGEAMRLIHNSGRKRMVEVYGDKVDADGNPIMETQEVTGTAADRSVSNPDWVKETDPRKKRMRFAVEVGENLGLFKRTLAYDMLDIDGSGGYMEKINAASGFMLHHGERVNREVAFTAAYNLEADMLDVEAAKANRLVSDAEYKQAAERAFYMVEMTNGGSASAASPKIMQNSIGSVVFMYKRYGVSMLSLLHKLTKEGMVGQSAQAKKLAWFQLAGIYGSAALMSGVRGVPFFGTAAMVFNMLKDDDEESAQSIVRRITGEGYYSGLINYVTGTNVATRIQLSDLLFRDVLIERDQPAIWTAIEMLGGPAVGITLQFDRAADLFGRGEFERAFESMAPSAMRNVMKSVRYYKDGGAESLTGELISPVHPLHAVTQALGFIPAELARAYEVNAEIKSMEKGTKARRKRILDDIARARADGDSAAEQLAYDQIPQYNYDHPDWPIDGDSIQKSMNSRSENSSEKFQGVSLHPKLRKSLLHHASLFSDDATLFF
jgi:hypothetical protein